MSSVVSEPPPDVQPETRPSPFLETGEGWLGSVRQQIVSSMWSTGRTAFTVALFLLGAYLIDNRQNVYLGLLFVGWSFARASTYVQTAYRLSLGRSLVDAVAETRANTRLELLLNVGAILDHPAAARAFGRLQRAGRIPANESFKNWRDALVSRFRERAASKPDQDSWANVVFEVRAGQLWKDGEYRRTSVMFHEVVVPHESLKREHAWALEDDDKYYGMRIRALVINGILKIQIGEWDEKAGYQEPGQKYSWVAWDTVTTFPLLLNPLDHYLPPRFLLFDYFSEPHHRKAWSRAKKSFNRHTDEYRRVLSTFGEYGENALWERQRKEFELWMKREDYRRTWGQDRPSWANPYLRIDIHAWQPDFDTYKALSSEGERRD